mgnify:CR=1 FL=1
MKNMDEVSKKIMEMGLTDRRSITSPENGRLGGRKPIPVQSWAAQFVESKYSIDLNGKPFYTLHYYAGEWYCYNAHWHTLKEDDLRSEVTGFLQKIECPARISTSLVGDIILNIKSSEICAILPKENKYKMPCFLSNGECAADWMPMQNRIVNIESAAEALANGAAVPSTAIREQSPELFITFGLPYSFDEAATCPKWEKYLSETQPNEENRKCLQMLAGLALVTDRRYNVMFFLYGEAGTGKSVFLEVLQALVGKDNTCHVPLSKMSERFATAPLTEKRLNAIGDMPIIPENGRIADVEGLLKDMAPGGEISVERKGIDGWDAPVIALNVFATNELPPFTDRSNGIWDRLRIIPFNQRFRGTDQQNPNLINELLEELPGILIWALKGLAMLRKLKTFPECAEGEAEKEKLRGECDHERTFLLEHTEPATGSWCSSDRLYQKYKEWMLNNGYRPVCAGKFKKAVQRLYPQAYVNKSSIDGTRIWRFWNIREKSDF